MEFEIQLARCVASVFPDLTAEQISRASVKTVPTWDSLAAITLVAVIAEEIGVEIDPLDLTDLTSYSAMRDYLEQRLEGVVERDGL